MGSELKKTLLLCLAISFIAPGASAATNKPSPAPTVKKSVAPTPVKKKIIVRKRIVHPKISLSPSPSPHWPLSGFENDKTNGEIWAKVPTAAQLISTASNNPSLTKELAQKIDGTRVCEKYSCGAVQVTSENGCTWWEISANVVDEAKNVLGTINRSIGKSNKRQVITVLLKSQEILSVAHSVSAINITCHHDVPATTNYTNIYTPVTKTN
jgi:hypothetical protein